MFTIYLITNIVNNKKYVGQTIVSLEKRWKRHCWGCTVKSKRMIISIAIEKHGKESFKIQQIDTAQTLEEANEKEVYWAKHHNCFSPFGYNLKAGGRKTAIVSKETRDRIKRGNLGKKASPETLKKLSESHKGIRLSKEAKEKLSRINKGKKPHPNTLDAQTNKNCKIFILLSPSGEEIKVTNMRKFCRENNLHPSNMCLLTKGRLESHNGWKMIKDCGYVWEIVGSRRHPKKS
jgi:group I intron endonuclease